MDVLRASITATAAAKAAAESANAAAFAAAALKAARNATTAAYGTPGGLAVKAVVSAAAKMADSANTAAREAYAATGNAAARDYHELHDTCRSAQKEIDATDSGPLDSLWPDGPPLFLQYWSQVTTRPTTDLMGM